MIVRLMGEGQWEVDEETVQGLNELDSQAARALDQGNEEQLRRLLEQMAKAVRDRGSRLDDADLSPSDCIIPPSDLSMDEAKDLFTGEGLIPDLPARS